MKIYLCILSLFICSITFAQTTVSGSVKDSKNEPIPGANIKVEGESTGTISDGDGKFTLSTSKKPPFTLEISSIGFGTQKVSVTSNNQNVTAESFNTYDVLNAKKVVLATSSIEAIEKILN